MSKTIRRSNAGLLPQVVSIAVLCSALAVPCARAEDVLPGTAYAMAVVFSRTVADEPTPRDAKPPIVASAAEDHVAPKVQNWIMRQIIGQKNAPANLAALDGQAASQAAPESRPDAAAAVAPGADNSVAGAPALMPEKSPADPNFDKWQRDANEKLKHEVDLTKRRENPLALAHPDSFVVACEAGCRDPKDHIIYMVLKTAASTRRLDVASSEVAQVSTPLQKAPAPVLEDEGSLPCVAGCYDSERPKKRQVAEKAGVVLASLATSSSIVETANPAAVSYQTHGTVRTPNALASTGKRRGSLALRSRRLAHQLTQHAGTERLQRPRLPGRHFEKITRLENTGHKMRRAVKIAYRFHR